MSESKLLPEVIKQLVEHFGVGQVIAAMLDHDQIAKKLYEGEHCISVRTVNADGSEWIQEGMLVINHRCLIGRSSRQRPVA